MANEFTADISSAISLASSEITTVPGSSISPGIEEFLNSMKLMANEFTTDISSAISLASSGITTVLGRSIDPRGVTS